MFSSKNKNTNPNPNPNPCKHQFYYIKVRGLRGSKLYTHAFVIYPSDSVFTRFQKVGLFVSTSDRTSRNKAHLLVLYFPTGKGIYLSQTFICPHPRPSSDIIPPNHIKFHRSVFFFFFFLFAFFSLFYGLITVPSNTLLCHPGRL